MRPFPALTLAIALCAAASLASAAEPQTDEQKALYALGVAMSQNLSSLSLTDAEIEVVKAGLVDGASFCSACGTQVPQEALEPEPLVAAAYGRRVIARLIDATIALVVPVAALAILIAQSQPPGQDASEPGQTGTGILLPVVAPLYSALLHRYWHGQTIGKRLLRIRVVTRTGRGLSLGASLGRSYLRMGLFRQARWSSPPRLRRWPRFMLNASIS